MKFLEISIIINELEDETIEVLEKNKKEKIEKEKIENLIKLYNLELLKRIAFKDIIDEYKNK